MTDEPRGDDHAGASAPWERPRRWNTQRLEATRVDDLLAKLGTTPSEGRRRRRESDDTESVSASSLIAALTRDPAASIPLQGSDQLESLQDVAPASPSASSAVVPSNKTLALITHPADPAPTAVAGTVVTDRDDGDRTVLLAQIPSPDPAPADESRTEIIPRITASESDRARSIRAVLAVGTVNPEPSPTGAGATTTAAPKAHDPHRSRRMLLQAGRAAVVVLTVLTLVFTGWYWNIKRRADAGIIANQAQGALNTSDTHIVKPTAQAGAAAAAAGVKIYAPENILLLGSDSRAGANGNAGNTDSTTGQSAQSDTMMVAHLSADRQHVTILSMPRDTVIPAPTCKTWDFKTDTYSDKDFPVGEGQLFHLTNAYAVGGPRCVVTAIQQTTGIKIDRFIGIDFAGFKAMVDAVGGITVNTCGPIVDETLNTITDHAGVQTFRGEMALNLVRARKVAGEKGSDLARIRRQQAVLSALLRQVTSAGTLTSPTKLDAFLQAFTKNTFTDGVTLDSLMTLAGSLGSFNPDTVTFYTLPTVPSQRVDGALEIDDTKAPAVFSSIINDEPLPGQTTGAARPPASKPAVSPTPRTSAAAPDLTITVQPAKVPLRIYNVTGRSGVAGKAQTDLNALGFKVTDDDLIKPDNDTRSKVTVEYGPKDRAAALTAAAAVPGATLVVNNALSGEVRLMLGSDFDGSVKAVTVGSKAPASLSTVSTAASSPSEQSDSGTSSSGDSGSKSAAPSTLKPSDLPAVNAANTDCIGPRPGQS